MGLDIPKCGVDFVPEYQISALPWVTSSTVSGYKRHRFSTTEEDPPLTGSDGELIHRWDRVTKWIIVKNNSSLNLSVGFTPRGLTTSSNYIVLGDNESFSADLRIKEIWLSGSGNTYQIVAGLTRCNANGYELTGSNGDIGVG